jgi:hypothetical protein
LGLWRGGGAGGLQLAGKGIDEWEMIASVANAEEQPSLDNDDIGGGGGGYRPLGMTSDIQIYKCKHR